MPRLGPVPRGFCCAAAKNYIPLQNFRTKTIHLASTKYASDIRQALAPGRRKVADRFDHAHFQRLVGRQVQVGIRMHLPLLLRQVDVTAQDALGTHVVGAQALDDDAERIGARTGRGGRMRLVHHEAGRVAGMAMPPRQKQGNGDGRHGACVVGNDVERQLAEEVIQTNAIADIAAVRLDQDVRGGELVFRDAALKTRRTMSLLTSPERVK